VTTVFSYAGTNLAVRLPQVGDVLSLWMRPHLKDAEILDILRTAEVRRLVIDSDGTSIDRALAREIVASESAYQAYREARHSELVATTEGGAISAECPHCLAWRGELNPLAVAVLLRSPFRPLVDPWGDPAVPAAADSGWRLTPAQASQRLWLTLPSRPSQPLPYGDAGERDRLASWQEWSREFFAAMARPDAPEGGRQDWSPDSPGWTALLRLVSAVPGLLPDSAVDSGLDPDTADPNTAVARVLAATRTPLADLLFADNVTWLTRLAPVPADVGPPVVCASCGREFLPLTSSPDWSGICPDDGDDD
jgi:hypothetical protein